MSKISMALFNSITGQRNEKLFEMPELIEEIAKEGNENSAKKDKPDELSVKKGLEIKKVQSFYMNMSSKINSAEHIPTKIDFHFDNHILESINDWEFCILDIKDVLSKYNMIWMMFHSMGFLEKYEIDINVFGRFLYMVQEKYNSPNNPFHNFDHGITGKNNLLNNLSHNKYIHCIYFSLPWLIYITTKKTI